MPGIFGFIGNGSNEDVRNRLNQMSAALQDEPSYESHLHIDSGEIGFGRTGLAIVQTQPALAWNETRTIVVVIEGEIYDYADHRASLEEKGHQFISDSHAELFTHFYEENGAEFVSHLNGTFVAAIWDRTQHRLTIVNDHLGLQPLYYTPNLSGGFAFASGVRALLAFPKLPRKLDRLAVAQFLTFDHILDDRTLLEDVKLLPAASILTYADGVWNIRNYWHLQYPEYYPVIGEAEYREKLLYLLRKAIKRQLPDPHPAAILLSGGFDSRVIAALLFEQYRGKSIQTFTMGQAGCDDERFAKEVSHRLGMPHLFYPLKGDYLRKYAEQGIRLSDGMGNIVHMHTLPNLSAQARQAKIIYKGFIGDALIGYSITNRHWANYSDIDLPQALLAIHRNLGLIVFDGEQLDGLMVSRPGECFSQLVMETHTQAMFASQAKLLADQWNFFILRQRVPRMTLNGVEWVRSQAHVRLPFADKELVEFVLTVPPGYRQDRMIIKDLFVRQFPELAKIPTTETNFPMVHCRRELLMRATEQTKWWLRSLGLKWVPIPKKQPYVEYDDWLRDELRSWAEGILLDKLSLGRGIFDEVAVRTLVNEHMAGENHHKKLGVLISIELWHRQFID